MEGYKNKEAKSEITFAKESSGVWERIVAQLVDKVVSEAVAHMKDSVVDEEKTKAIRTVVEEEVRALLENNAELINANTINWREDIANASDAASAEEMKARRLREILDEKSGGNLTQTLSEKTR